MLEKTKAEIDLYNENPNYCLYCNKPILANYTQKLYHIKIRKFCSQSCSAKYNNYSRAKEKNQCSVCGKEILRKSKMCVDCAHDMAITFPFQTKKESLDSRSSYQSWRSSVQRHAVYIFNNSGKDRKCLICGYNIKIDVCHIAPVASFSNDAKILEINDIDNLVALCPNHHWEFDHHLISLMA